ncbi:cysteine proteinase [Periconia macrospinosa]|uniref:ubiquitinyl hydrolase 1 n=1 Tax=Periconia macrospinosa TaxID=97972 RepID=A0A2V1DYU7_9PLEO|nr:cysteine proteinase [Periconia macrospinosa]
MSGFYHDDDDGHRAFHAFNDRRSALEISATTTTAKVLTALLGLFIVFKALEFFGYPVWLWIHMATARINTFSLASRTPPAETTSDGEQPTTMIQKGGQLLGSVFGLNSTSLLQKGVRGVTTFSGGVGSSHVPPGLGNWDNSCFQNSVIQGMSALPSLRDYLSKTTAENRSFDINTTNGALFDIISKLADPNHPGGHFWIRGKLKSMSTFQQQDAQEYYSKIMDALDKEVQAASKNKRKSSASFLEATKSLEKTKKIKTAAPADGTIKEEGEDDQESSEQKTVLPNPLDGLLAQRVGCIKCGYSEGLQLIPFNCLTVSLGTGSVYDIRDCLTTYTELEHIEGVECAKCTLLRNRDALAKVAATSNIYKERLELVEEALEDEDFNDKTLVKKFNIPKKNWATTTKSRQAVIARAPKALVMHVNRSIFNEWTGQLQKNDATVFYPQILDLGNWCLGNQPSETNAPDNAVEEWPRDPVKSMLGDPEAEPVMDSPFQYRLRAAVTHFGTHGSGHYVCFRPHPKRANAEEDITEEAEESKVEEQWWRFSDESVYPVAEEQAHQGNVFMLFYERIDGPGDLADEAEASSNAVTVPEDLPLPPLETAASYSPLDGAAIDIPLPGEDSDAESLLDISTSEPLTPPTIAESSPSSTETTPSPPSNSENDRSAYPTPPPEECSTAPSEADSEDMQDTESTLFTSEDESPVFPIDPAQLKIAHSPQLMRTAGNSPARRRGGGGRRSLPMVSAL